MAKRDYYDVLGINKGTDETTIKKAYRGLAMQYHPDKNPDNAESAEKMKEINEAYAVLSDQEKRRLYDTYGHAGLQGFTQEDIFRGADFSSILDGLFGGGFFNSFFGRQRPSGGRRARKGADLRYDLTVTLEDVVFGKDEEIEIPRVETCPTCDGSGAKRGGVQECEACHGTGQSVTEQRSGYSVFRQITTCPKCRGRGKTIADPCQDCGGRGSISKSQHISVHIPKGADTGYAVRVEEEGKPGVDGAPNGDLYVVINVEEHPVFERHGNDIYVLQEIDLVRAALGGELNDIPGLEGNVQLEIPEGTQNGAVFRIVDKGAPHLNNYGRGDQYVVMKVVTPTDLTEKEKELLRKVQELREKRSN